MTNASMKVWQTPRVSRYGAFAEATAQAACNKDFGGDDGFTFQNQPVVCTS